MWMKCARSSTIHGDGEDDDDDRPTDPTMVMVAFDGGVCGADNGIYCNNNWS